LPSDGLFAPSLTIPAMAAAVSDEAWLRGMLVFERELAAAEASFGVIPEPAARAIARKCDVENFDLAELGREAAGSAGPVVPLVRRLREVLPTSQAGYVHWGATSQDTLDTAMMLVAKDAIGVLLNEVGELAAACADLAERHRATVMPGRTLLQQALPITFGLKAAVWLAGETAVIHRLTEIRRHRLAVQLGGGAGTLAALGEHGLEVMTDLARRLGLSEPTVAWHSERSRVAELGAGLGLAAGQAAKVAGDIALLSQTEVGEVAEASPGRSSAMPHKRNPVAAVEADAAARGALAQAMVLMSSLRSEHERAAGAWQAEWHAVSEAFRLAAGAVAGARRAVAGLKVDSGRMRANLDLGGGLVMSESLTLALSPKLGRSRAHELVEAAAGRAVEAGSLRDAVAGDSEITTALTQEEIAAALDPERYLGSAQLLIDRALSEHRAWRETA
jgi:3-carboxy-cis,cis-muconate cycloisomerase